MPVNRTDELFTSINEQLCELLSSTEEEGLNEEEDAILADLQGKLFALWEAYLDRMVVKLAASHPDPETAVALAAGPECVEELRDIQERVQTTRLAEGGVPLALPAKKQPN